MLCLSFKQNLPKEFKSIVLRVSFRNINIDKKKIAVALLMILVVVLPIEMIVIVVTPLITTMRIRFNKKTSLKGIE